MLTSRRGEGKWGNSVYGLMLLVVAAGAAVAVQAGVNGRLGTALNSSGLAALASFVIGTLALLVYLAVTRPAFPESAAFARVPPWGWIGGLLGAFYVAIAILATPRLGVAVTLGLVVAGQMLASVVLDHFGWLGLARQPVSLFRVLGIALIIGGVVLVRR